MTEYEQCPHGRHVGAYCEPCEEEKLLGAICDAYANAVEVIWGEQKDEAPEINPYINTSERQSGLNASYYDFPCKNAQELIEWLELDFSNGNILKSLIRENNPISQKDTNELYEAEKRYYYAHRHLRSVQKKWATGDFDSTDVEKGLENKTKE